MSIINWNATIQFPTDTCFENRILKATFAPAKTGNVGISLETEIVRPETYMVGEQEVNIAGVKARPQFPLMTKIFDERGELDEEKTAACRARVFVSTNPDQPSFWEKLGLDGSKEDPENPNVKQLEGLIIMVQMSSRLDEQRRTPTAEQIAKAKKAGIKPIGDIMKHPGTGKVLVKYWPQIDEIFGISKNTTAGGNKPY
jgi:hypothetical protein